MAYTSSNKKLVKLSKKIIKYEQDHQEAFLAEVKSEKKHNWPKRLEKLKEEIKKSEELIHYADFAEKADDECLKLVEIFLKQNEISSEHGTIITSKPFKVMKNVLQKMTFLFDERLDLERERLKHPERTKEYDGLLEKEKALNSKIISLEKIIKKVESHLKKSGRYTHLSASHDGPLKARDVLGKSAELTIIAFIVAGVILYFGMGWLMEGSDVKSSDSNDLSEEGLAKPEIDDSSGITESDSVEEEVDRLLSSETDRQILLGKSMALAQTQIDRLSDDILTAYATRNDVSVKELIKLPNEEIKRPRRGDFKADEALASYEELNKFKKKLDEEGLLNAEREEFLGIVLSHAIGAISGCVDCQFHINYFYEGPKIPE
ncbi:hypothetical protein ACFL0W_00440 [Nanoarchaeota archaeon]